MSTASPTKRSRGADGRGPAAKKARAADSAARICSDAAQAADAVVSATGWFSRAECLEIARERSRRCCVAAVQPGDGSVGGAVVNNNDPIIPWSATLAFESPRASVALGAVELVLDSFRQFEMVTRAKSPELIRFLTLYRMKSNVATNNTVPDLSRHMFISMFDALDVHAVAHGVDAGDSSVLFVDDECLKCCLNALSFSLEFALGPTQLPQRDRGFVGWGASGGQYPLTRMLLFEFAKSLRHIIMLGDDGVGKSLRLQLTPVLLRLKRAMCVP